MVHCQGRQLRQKMIIMDHDYMKRKDSYGRNPKWKIIFAKNNSDYKTLILMDEDSHDKRQDTLQKMSKILEQDFLFAPECRPRF